MKEVVNNVKSFGALSETQYMSQYPFHYAIRTYPIEKLGRNIDYIVFHHGRDLQGNNRQGQKQQLPGKKNLWSLKRKDRSGATVLTLLAQRIQETDNPLSQMALTKIQKRLYQHIGKAPPEAKPLLERAFFKKNFARLLRQNLKVKSYKDPGDKGSAKDRSL